MKQLFHNESKIRALALIWYHSPKEVIIQIIHILFEDVIASSIGIHKLSFLHIKCKVDLQQKTKIDNAEI